MLVVAAVNSMLEKKEDYAERWEELKNSTRDALADFDVDLDEILDGGGCPVTEI
jgi:hypothetical protein